MPRHAITLLATLLALLLFTGCSSDGVNEAKAILEQQVNITENYVNGLESASSADDIAATIDTFTQDMQRLIPDLEEFQKKYPGYMAGKAPEGTEEARERLQAASKKIQPAMMNAMRYMTDPKVQAAMMRMQEELGKLEQR